MDSRNTFQRKEFDIMALEKSVTFGPGDVSHIKLSCVDDKCSWEEKYDLACTITHDIDECPKCLNQWTEGPFGINISAVVLHACRAFRTAKDMTLTLRLHTLIDPSVIVQDTDMVTTYVVCTPSDIAQLDIPCPRCSASFKYNAPRSLTETCPQCEYHLTEAPDADRNTIRDLANALKNPPAAPRVQLYVPLR